MDLRTDDGVRALLDRVLAGEVAWTDAGRQFANAMSDEFCDDDRLVDVIWAIENYAWQRSAMTDPETPGAHKDAWTAEMDANVVAEIREILEAE